MDYLLKTSALLLLMYLGYSIFLKKETFFNHNRWFLLVGIITATLLPLIEIPVYIPVETTAELQTPIQFQYVTTEVIVEESFDWQQFASYLYITGILVFLIQFLLQFGSLVILLLQNTKNKEGIYTYVIVKNKISPFSFFKWIVYNPNLFSSEELGLILNHEKVHVRQWHSVDIIISRIACILFWFNPISWLYHKTIQQNLEYIADDKTQNISASEKKYQELLLKTSIGNTNINLTSNFYNSLIKKRIVMLQKNRSKSVSRWKSAIVIPFFILFLMSFNTKEVYIEMEKPLVENSTSETHSDFKNVKLIEIIFSKDTSEEEIKGLKTELKTQGIEMNVKKIKRNKDGEIIKINISFESKNGSTNYSVSDDEGITPFYFKLDDNNNMSVGSFKNKIIEVIEEPELIEEVIEVIEERQPEITEEVIEVIEEKQPAENKTKTFVIRGSGHNTKISGDTIRIIEGSANTKASYRYFTTDSVKVNNVKTRIKINGNAKVNNKKYIIRTDSVRLSSFNKNKKPIFILNGKRISENNFQDIYPTDIEKINVLKDKKATTIYGKAGKNGVIEIITKNNANKKNPWAYNVEVSKIEYTPSSTKEEAEIFIKSAKKPFIIVNGKILGNTNIKSLDPDVISEISVIKGDKAIEMYGSKAKDGALIIFTKDEIEKQKINVNKKYTTEISAVGYVDDKNPEEKMVLYFISKMTQKSMIDQHISQLKSVGITAKISKLKRNSDGDITRIKISLKDDEGNNSSATFENKNGIPTINFGKQGGNLVVSSKKF